MPELPLTTNYQLFRIIQECLTNVLKHANATKVTIQLDQGEERIELTIKDNGCGLNDNVDSYGFGIKGIQERVESMQGTLRIATQSEQGTEFHIVIPL